MTSHLFASIAAIALLAGCAAQVQRAPVDGSDSVRVPAASSKRVVLVMSGAPAVATAKDWEQFKGEWRAAFKAESAANGISFAMPDDDERPARSVGTLLSVHVNDYRYLTPGARYGFGVFTGNAYIDAKASFSDLAGGKSFGQSSVNTSSSAWQGIFSAMTEKQVQAIAKELIGEVKGAR